MAGYSGTPLARKLGVTAGTSVLLDGAPTGFDLGDLPADVRVVRGGGDGPYDVRVVRHEDDGPYDVILCFCPDQARLTARWPVLHKRTTVAGSLWIAWPKRSAGVPTDLDENVVREYALSHGRVDVKVCAIDDVWSGLKHVIRKADR